MSAADCQLHVLLARKARVGAILRRGPSKEVALIRWELAKDRFEVGQWIKARVYERRCDISPDGALVALFVGNFKRNPGTWTALSRPPFFTALAMWPKGDAWGGGGLFESNRRLLLNHGAHQAALAEGFVLPRGFQVAPLGAFAGRGEDEPIYSARQRRDDWRLEDPGQHSEYSSSARLAWRYDPPLVWSKPAPRHPQLELRSMLLGVHERNGRWYRVDHLLRLGGEPCGPDLQRTEWADWDTNGDLLFTKAGRLFRTRIGKGGAPGEPALLADFRALKFSANKAPPQATQWPS